MTFIPPFIHAVLEFLGFLVCLCGVLLLAWGILTYQKPDYSRPEDRDDKGEL